MIYQAVVLRLAVVILIPPVATVHEAIAASKHLPTGLVHDGEGAVSGVGLGAEVFVLNDVLDS